MPLSVDPVLPRVFTREQARAAGMTNRQVDRRLRSGRWCAVRRGVLMTAPVPSTSLTPGAIDGAPRFAEQRLAGQRDAEDAARAALLTQRSGAVVSHQSAAILWGLPTPLSGPGRVMLTCGSGSGPTRYSRGVVVEVAGLPARDVENRHGLPITSLARTVADCLRHLPSADAIAIGDAALRLDPHVAECLHEVLLRCERWPGAARAAVAAAVLDGRRESPLESWSAWGFTQSGLAVPEPQVVIRDADGRLVGRVDYWWAEGVVGEADGKAKYALAAAEAAGADAAGLAAVLQLERRRERDLRALGTELVRWGAHDVLNRVPRARLVARVEDARGLAATRKFTGTATPSPRHGADLAHLRYR